MIDSNRRIKVFGGTRTKNSKTGTIVWNWLDGDGREHKLWILNYSYVPHVKLRLMISKKISTIQE